MKFNKVNIKEFFRKNFSFDSGVDLNDDVEVLYRRNIVIKNIIFVSNIVYSIILFVVTIGSASIGVNWLWSVIPLPLTFVLNQTLKKIINNDKKELLRQQIGMYVCAFYMIVSALLVYMKLIFTDSTNGYAEAGYLLFYFSLIVISFYQDTKMLRNIFIWMIALLTVVHFTLTHNFAEAAKNGFWDFITNVIPNDPTVGYELRDILFRTLVAILFMISIYVTTSVAEKLAFERKNELSKRTDIQAEYIDVLSDLYDVLLETKIGYDENKEQIPLLKKMCYRLASISGCSDQASSDIASYASYNLDHEMSLDFSSLNSNEEKFEQLRIQSQIGKMVARRMQLQQKCENIVRAHLGGWANQEFIKKMNNIQNNKESQIILLCDLYISLRSPKSYKRPYSHSNTMEKIMSEFRIYFQRDILAYFERFNTEFLNMYDNFEL